MILESHKSINDLYGRWLSIFEAVSIYIFSFEYIYRVYKAYKEGSSNGEVCIRFFFVRVHPQAPIASWTNCWGVTLMRQSQLGDSYC